MTTVLPAMEIVEHTIKCVDQYKFRIALPFRHINPNMPNYRQQADSRFYQQRRMLCKNAEVKHKYIEKIKRLKEEGYIEQECGFYLTFPRNKISSALSTMAPRNSKINPLTLRSYLVLTYLSHFLM